MRSIAMLNLFTIVIRSTLTLYNCDIICVFSLQHAYSHPVPLVSSSSKSISHPSSQILDTLPKITLSIIPTNLIKVIPMSNRNPHQITHRNLTIQQQRESQQHPR